MSGVANDNGRETVVVGLAFDADEGEVGVGVEGGDQLGGGDEVGDAGEVGVEKVGDVGARGVGFEKGVEFGGGEEGAGEGAVLKSDD